MKRRNKTSKAASAWLERMVEAFVHDHGGCWQKPNDPALGLILPTKVGPLHVYPYEESIAGRFEDVKAACDHFGVKYGEIFGHDRLSGYTGKWNFHTFDVPGGKSSKSMERVVALFETWKYEVEPLLVEG